MPNQDDHLRREFERQFGKVRQFTLQHLTRTILVVVGLVLALVGSAGSFYTVAADEVGIVLRFGKLHVVTEPGLQFKIPFGVDSVTTVKVKRVQKEEFGFRTLSEGQRTQYSAGTYPEESLMLTADLGIADVSWIVQYRIKDASMFLFKVRDAARNGLPSTLRDVSEHVVRPVVGDSSIDEVLTLRRREIALESKRLLQEIMDGYESGIEIVTLELQSINPPEAVRSSFHDVNSAIQQKQTSINEARREWNKDIPSATGKAAQMVEAAEGYKVKRINEARGDVARFSLLLEEYTKAKEVTRTRLYLEALEEVIPSIAQIYIIDGDQSPPLQILDLQKAAGARSRVESAPSRNPAVRSRTRTER